MVVYKLCIYAATGTVKKRKPVSKKTKHTEKEEYLQTCNAAVKEIFSQQHSKEM